ncbi:TraB/VirB10 family protein [Candidatus Lariskella endosymbiont of Hedychridium roseum]|uniref:TraB/VirB10 family protein n=1 Tax=Candidatus Lariskella endosymbiont of Hedychridium roseum TaxID=3077949 RepID=UPI0030CD814C
MPAGSMAKAALLSGVAASTSLSSASNPKPILLRILDHGTLPRRFQSDLKDCNIIGAVSGNLSSERIEIRLEKMTCIDTKTKRIVETDIAGFVAGEDGIEGVKGEVISREGALLVNSLISGTLGGLANNFNSNTARRSIEIVSNPSAAPSIVSRLGDSFASGGDSALDNLAKYYISKAESLQPVIEIGAGRKVDVIFTVGAFFGADDTKRSIENSRSGSLAKQEAKNSLVQSWN